MFDVNKLTQNEIAVLVAVIGSVSFWGPPVFRSFVWLWGLLARVEVRFSALTLVGVVVGAGLLFAVWRAIR